MMAPTLMSGHEELRPQTAKEATKTETFAKISFLEHSHTERMMSSAR
jgi:hypothetical protein